MLAIDCRCGYYGWPGFVTKCPKCGSSNFSLDNDEWRDYDEEYKDSDADTSHQESEEEGDESA